MISSVLFIFYKFSYFSNTLGQISTLQVGGMYPIFFFSQKDDVTYTATVCEEKNDRVFELTLKAKINR